MKRICMIVKRIRLLYLNTFFVEKLFVTHKEKVILFVRSKKYSIEKKIEKIVNIIVSCVIKTNLRFVHIPHS